MKALIVGVLSFAIVAAVGGAAVMSYFTPSALPTFGASPAEQTAVPAKPFVSRTGAENRTSDAEPGAVGVAEAAPAATPASSLALTPKLEVSEHLDATGASSSAELRFKEKVVEEKRAAGVKPSPTAAKSDSRNAAVASSVHYGVTNRSELMTRANGSVSNVMGRGTKAQAGQMAGAKLADIQKQLEDAPLSPEDRAKLKKELDPLSKNLEAAVKDDGAQ